MNPSLAVRLADLPLVATTWEVGSFSVPTVDAGEVVHHAVLDPMAREARGLGAASALDVVIEAMCRPMSQGAPRRPEALICANAELALALGPLTSVVRIRVGPTPAVEAFAEGARDNLGRPELLVPVTNLDRWRPAFSALVHGSGVDLDLRFRFAGGALEGRTALWTVVPPAFQLNPPADGAGYALTVAAIRADQLRAETVELGRADGLVIDGWMPIAMGSDADGHGPLAPADHSVLLDALSAAASAAERFDRAGAIGPITARATVRGRSVDVIVGLAEEEEEEVRQVPLEPLLREDHLVLVARVPDPESGARIPRVTLKLGRGDALLAAPRVAPIDRLTAVRPQPGRLVLVGWVGEEPRGWVEVWPRDAALLDRAEVVLLAVAEGGVISPTVQTRRILHLRRVPVEEGPAQHR